MIKLIFACSLSLILVGCSFSEKCEPNPEEIKSLLVLPPKNNTFNPEATNSIISKLTKPLSKAGYYVFPIAVTEQLFHQNGVTITDEIHLIDQKKLFEIFKADAVLYINIDKYDFNNKILSTEPTVSISAKMVSLKTGKLLWDKKQTVTGDSDSKINTGFFLTNMIMNAVVNPMLYDFKPLAEKNIELLFNHENQCLPYGKRLLETN